jgi:hypothetical protein
MFKGKQPVFLPMAQVFAALDRALAFPDNSALQGLPAGSPAEVLATVYCPTMRLRGGATLVFTGEDDPVVPGEWTASGPIPRFERSPGLSFWASHDVQVDRTGLSLLALAIGLNPGEAGLGVGWWRERDGWALHAVNGWLAVENKGKPSRMRDFTQVLRPDIAAEKNPAEALKLTLLHVLAQPVPEKADASVPSNKV